MNEPSKQPTASETSTADLRIGVYVCRCGGNISDVVDVERVAEIARHIPGVTLSKVHMFMCSDPGQQAISEDIRKEGLNRVVVAACTPTLHELTFRGAVVRAKMNPHLYEHVNIREQCSWSHKHDPSGATAQALRLIAAAVGKVSRAVPLEPISLPNNRKALVIGGGIAGMKVAADLAGRGIPVILVEQSSRLGGNLHNLNRIFPSEQAASAMLAALEARMTDNPHVQVLLNSRVTAVSGCIGNFQTSLEGAFGPSGKTATVSPTVGVIVVATGFRPYVPATGEFLYQSDPGVVTMPEFIQLLRETPDGARKLIYKDRPIRSIAFIHCVGSRQLDDVHTPQADGKINNYCSRVCCTTVLQQALALKTRFPEVAVYDLHQDIRTYGRGHEDYYIDASKAGVTFMRYHGEEPPKVEAVSTKKGESPLRVTVKDYLTWGEELRVPVDMVVLAVGMMAGSIAGLMDMLKLPVGEDRFVQEIHPKLRPVEVSVNGVLLAGTAQGPMNIQETLAAAGAAAVKASAMFAKEVVEINPYVAQVNAARCDGAGQCVTQCEYDGALKLVTRQVEGRSVQRAEVNPGLCIGCGSCVAVCPNRAIDLNGWRLDQYEAMVDGLVTEWPEPVAAIPVPA